MEEKDNSLRELISSGRYDEASKILSERERSGRLSSSELVLKGRCLQLSAHGGRQELEEAERAFSAALSTDQEYVPALLELGWFYHAVQNDRTQALPLFERALAICKAQLEDAAKGISECLEESE